MNKYPAPAYAEMYGDAYTFIISKNFKKPSDAYEIQSILIDILKNNGISTTPSQSLKENYELLLDAQPAWLDIPEDFLMTLIDQANGKRGRA